MQPVEPVKAASAGDEGAAWDLRHGTGRDDPDPVGELAGSAVGEDSEVGLQDDLFSCLWARASPGPVSPWHSRSARSPMSLTLWTNRGASFTFLRLPVVFLESGRSGAARCECPSEDR